MLSLLLLSQLSISYSQQCLALCLSGGGAKGSYEAGVLYTMNNSTKNINMAYNIITGVSIGAINAGILTNFPIGQEQAMVESLVNRWLSINGSSDVYVEWGGGLITGLLFHGGIYNNDPAVELGHLWITGPRQRNITVGSVNLDLGFYGNFDESFGAAIVDAVQASSSVPFFFSPKTFAGYSWADGGGVINLDIEAGILRCLEITGNQRNVIVDVIYDDSVYTLPSATSFKTPGVFERMFQIRNFDSGIWYTYNAQQAYPNVNYRYTVIPSGPMGPLLNFSKVDILNSLNLGYKDGMAIFQETRSSIEIIKEHLERTRTIIYP
jgi:hypothetical protein